MFRCKKCNLVSLTKEKPVRVVVQTRNVKYPFRKDANIVPFLTDHGTRLEYVDDPGGEGWEIVVEQLWHQACFSSEPVYVGEHV